MRRSRTSPSARSKEQSLKMERAVCDGSSPPIYGSWTSSVDYIKSLQTLSERLESLELTNVARNYSQKLAFDGIPKDFCDHTDQKNAKEPKHSTESTSKATAILVHAQSGSLIHDHVRARHKMPRSPYDCNDSPKTMIERRQPSHSRPTSVVRTLSSPSCSSAFENSGSDIFLRPKHETQEFLRHELDEESVELGFGGSKSGSRPSSSNISRNFSASECSMFYSPSRCSGLSSSTNQSIVSSFRLPSVCMMSDYSAKNFQNRRLGASSRLRRLKNTDYELEKSNRDLFIAKNGANRSCMLASQKKHSNLRSACPLGTIIAQDDLAKYRRLRNCDPNLASRELVRDFLVARFH